MNNAKKIILVCISAVLVMLLGSCKCCKADKQVRRISVDEYVDKMKGGWVGQMIGVGWGAPSEFKSCSKIMPPEMVPQWKPDMVNVAGQDDLYVEMTFVRSMEVYGLNVSAKQAGIDFANSKYGLWCANRAGRDNLRLGIAPPDSGHPKFNPRADDIDYQIEADFSGLISPGMPNHAVLLGEKFGTIINYGDGLYAGQFMGALYSEAFFESSVEKLVEKALQYIPKESYYAQCIADVLKWYRQEPNDWQKTWNLVQEKYHNNPQYRKFTASTGDGNIDAKLNGAYVVMGLLYGRGDIEKTIVIAMRCGQDSDCNPSSAGGVLCTTLGFAKIPRRFVSAMNIKEKFAFTDYNVPAVIAVSEKLARQMVISAGGKIEKDKNGKEFFVISVEAPKPSAYTQSWAPGPIANSRYTPQEQAKITEKITHSKLEEQFQAAVDKAYPGWKMQNFDGYFPDQINAEWNGKKNVIQNHSGCTLVKKFAIPQAMTTTLTAAVASNPGGVWTMSIRVDGKEIANQKISQAKGSKELWRNIEVDLNQFAGREVNLELNAAADSWGPQGCAYWAEIAIVSK